MATYMFLLFDDESWWDDLTDESWQAAMVEHQALTLAAGCPSTTVEVRPVLDTGGETSS